ncbi:hypothetical protein C2845_PM16G02620 [Panicum miliaceum]|uniref:Uncharacterized protein n=1 Tax=Panicum miliaceum TaxID=4540 RepID=A0A3L6PTI5_PANMI|nr:hypothetical protein C2845_PM16G02620 [Panicum miliaceum]
MATTRTKHVVLFPFPGQGHLSSFLAVAGLLRRELPDATVTLVSTPRNVAALRSSAAAESSSIGLHALPFVPADHGLPAGCESTSSLPLHEFFKLFEASSRLFGCVPEPLRSLTHGVPLMGWPLAAEQFYNVKTLEEVWGVCVEVARGNLESSAVDRSKVADLMEKVMGGTVESAAMRRRVAEVQQVLRKAWAEDGGSSLIALHEFLRAMQLR